MSTVYLATPIDQAAGALSATRVEAVRRLQDAGLVVYDPAAAWTGDPSGWSTSASLAIGRVNEYALEEADGLLAILPDGVASIGVPMEIEQVARRDKPVVVVGGVKARTAPSIRALDGVIVTGEVGDGVAMLHQWLVGGDEARYFMATAGVLPEPAVVGTEVYLQAIRAEVERAAVKFPRSDENGRAQWFSIWAEEVVEAFQAYNDYGALRGQADAPTLEDVRMEIVQVAAMGARLWLSLSPATGAGSGHDSGEGAPDPALD